MEETKYRINLTPQLREHFKKRPRTIGRYSVTDLHDIVRGNITPEQWLAGKNFPTSVLLAMLNGTIVHEYIQTILKDGEVEKKFEYNHNFFGESFTLVGKIDFLPNNSDEVWEFKTSSKYLDKVPEAYEFQARAYCTLAKRDKAIILQPTQDKYGLYLECVKEVERDDNWFESKLPYLEEFHKKVLLFSDNPF